MGAGSLNGVSSKGSLLDGCKAKYFLLVVCGFGALLIMHRWTSEGQSPQSSLLADGPGLQSYSGIVHGASDAFLLEKKNSLQEERGAVKGLADYSNLQQSQQQEDEQKQQGEQLGGEQEEQQEEQEEDSQGPVPLPAPKQQQVSFLDAQDHFKSSKEMLLSEPSVYGSVQKEGILNLDDWSMRHVPDRVEDFVGWRMNRTKGVPPADENSYTCAAADHPPTSYPGCHVFINEK
jgi:hypothetical protein